jgi:predicted O-methyltransferase YrrM
LLAHVAKILARHINLRRVVALHRRRLSRKIFKQCGGVIQHGPFSGMRLLGDPRWGLSDQGAMILGMYEQEVLESLADAPAHFRVFVDIGAADGYYAVGLLKSGRVERAVGFEANPEGRATIARLAAKNGVSDKVTILGAASDNFVEMLSACNVNSSETMFLVDIEGAEFKVLTEEVFAFLKDSMIIVETHAHIYPDPQAEMEGLIKRASATHRSTTRYPGPRNPSIFKELEDFSETDRWIVCSEGRHEIQQWLRFDPL